MIIKIKRLKDNIELPSYQTDGAAAMDIAADIDVPATLMPNMPMLIPTGLAIELPSRDYAALMFARSGLSLKKGIALVNGVGVIDSDYRGELKVGLINLSDTPQTIEPGQRVAQLMIIRVCHAVWDETQELTDTKRGINGHGSTGEV